MRRKDNVVKSYLQEMTTMENNGNKPLTEIT